MAPVFRELVINWGGEEYRVKPTMAIIQRVEGQGLVLSWIAHMLDRGRPPFSHIAGVIAAFLQEAGAEGTVEDVYAEITQMETEQLREIVTAILHAAFPWVGKDEAPATDKRKKTPRKKSTGASSTR